MTDDDSLLRLYNQELIALSGQTLPPHHLENPDATARAVSPICGSEVTVEIKIQNGKVVDFGYAVDACALTRAVVAVMKKAIIGKGKDDIAAAGQSLRKMLAGEGPAPAGDWEDLKILTPVIDYKARHNAIMLPFEAVNKAFACFFR